MSIRRRDQGTGEDGPARFRDVLAETLLEEFPDLAAQLATAAPGSTADPDAPVPYWPADSAPDGGWPPAGSRP